MSLISVRRNNLLLDLATYSLQSATKAARTRLALCPGKGHRSADAEMELKRKAQALTESTAGTDGGETAA